MIAQLPAIHERGTDVISTCSIRSVPSCERLVQFCNFRLSPQVCSFRLLPPVLVSIWCFRLSLFPFGVFRLLSFAHPLCSMSTSNVLDSLSGYHVGNMRTKPVSFLHLLLTEHRSYPPVALAPPLSHHLEKNRPSGYVQAPWACNID